LTLSDVLETPQEKGIGDLGVRSFGGDPFWVGEMGRAYVTGVHNGSQGRMAVVAKHFPGHGSSDRLPEEEVATVRKSLEQLKQIELPPYYAVTGNAPSPEATVDGLLASHIRYQGFQGNIRETTRPVSLDRQALINNEFHPETRRKMAVMVSDNREVGFRRSIDPLTVFQARFIARDAFLAGNDLLFWARISSRRKTLTHIRQLYAPWISLHRNIGKILPSNSVDESVLRILT
jgi:beta-N-acetylhexosaminidase